MSKQNGTRAREVLLVLGLDKMVHLRLQAPGIPLQLAYVSYPKPYTEALPGESCGPLTERTPKSAGSRLKSSSLEVGFRWMGNPGQLQLLTEPQFSHLLCGRIELSAIPQNNVVTVFEKNPKSFI